MAFDIYGNRREIRMNDSLRTRWWNLKGGNLIHFKDIMIKEGSWTVYDETQIMYI